MFPSVDPPLWPDSWDMDELGGIPFSWHESKDTVLWKDFLAMLRAGAVWDLTPSPTLATVCLEMELPYFGTCPSDHYAFMMGEQLDKASIMFRAKTPV